MPEGFPCCMLFAGVHAVAITPAQRLSALSTRFLSRTSLPGNGDPVGLCIQLFRGLLTVQSHYNLHARWITQADPLHRGLQPIRYRHVRTFP